MQLKSTPTTGSNNIIGFCPHCGYVLPVRTVSRNYKRCVRCLGTGWERRKNEK